MRPIRWIFGLALLALSGVFVVYLGEEISAALVPTSSHQVSNSSTSSTDSSTVSSSIELSKMNARGYRYRIIYSFPGPLPCLTFPNPNPGDSPVVNAGSLGTGVFHNYIVICVGSSVIIEYESFRRVA